MDGVDELTATMAVVGQSPWWSGQDRLEMGWASWVQAAYWNQSGPVSYAQ